MASPSIHDNLQSHHRLLFDSLEAQTSLYQRFLALNASYDLIDQELMVITVVWEDETEVEVEAEGAGEESGEETEREGKGSGKKKGKTGGK